MADYSVNYAINVVDNGSKGLQSFQASAEKVLKMMKPFQNLTRTIDKLNASLGKISSKSFKVNVNASGATKSVGLLNKQLAALERRLGTLSAPHNIVVNTSMNGATGTGRGAAAAAAGTGRGTAAPSGTTRGHVGHSGITPYYGSATSRYSQPLLGLPQAPRYGRSIRMGGTTVATGQTIYAGAPNRGIVPIQSPAGIIPSPMYGSVPPRMGSRYGFAPGGYVPFATVRGGGSSSAGPIAMGGAAIPAAPIVMGGRMPSGMRVSASGYSYIPGGLPGGYVYGMGAGISKTGYTKPKIPFSSRSGGGAGMSSFRGRGDLGAKVFGAATLDSGGIGISSMLKGMGVMYGITGLGGLMGQAIHDVAEWDDTMIAVKNILKWHDPNPGTFDSRFTSMQKEIRDVGVKTKFTAPDVANAARFLAMANYGSEDIKTAMLPIADLATIGREDIGFTADKMTNIMTAFGIKSKDVRSAADVIANSFTMGNTDLEMMANSLEYFGPLANIAKQDFAMIAAALPVMGNSGVQSSMAGTGLRRAMQNIAMPRGKKKQAAWDAIGIKRHKEDGTLKSLFEIVQELHDKGVEYSNANKSYDLLRLFDTNGATAIAPLITHFDDWKRIYEENIKVQGSGFTEKLANEQRNSIPGLWDQITSAFTENSMQAYEGIQKPVQDLLKGTLEWMKSKDAAAAVRTFANGLLDIIEAVKGITMGFVSMYEKFGPIINGWLKFQLIMVPVLTTLRAVRATLYMGKYVHALAMSVSFLSLKFKSLGIHAGRFVGMGKALKTSFNSMASSYVVPGGVMTPIGHGTMTSATGATHSNVSKKVMERYGRMYGTPLVQSYGRSLGSIAGGLIGGYLGSNLGEPGSFGQIAGMFGGGIAGSLGGNFLGQGVGKGAGWLWRNKKIAGGAGAAALAMYLGYKALQSRGENNSGVENEASGSGLAAMATMMALPMLPKALGGITGLFTKGGGLITLAFSNPVMTAITALTVALAAFTALNWDDIKSFFTGEEKTGKFTTRVIRDKDGNIISEETLPEGANTAFGRAKEESLRKSLYETPDGTYDYAHRYLFGENGSTAAAVEQYIANLFGGNTLLDVWHSQTEGWGFGDMRSLSEIWQDQLNGWKEAWQTAKTWASTKWNELMSGIEELLAPIWVPMKSAIGSIGEWIASVWSKITEWIPTKIREIWQGLVAKFPILGEMGDFLSGLVKPSSAPSSGSQVTTQYPGGPYNLTNTKKLNEGFNTKKQSNESQDEKGYNQGWKPMSRNEGSLINIENINVNGDGTFDTAALEREMINVFTRCVNSSGLLYGQGHTV